MLRIPHCLGNRLIDGDEVVILTHRPRFTIEEHSWCSFLLKAEYTPGPTVRVEGAGKFKKKGNGFI
jgi:hypothetical protein